ncbi:putative polygalacturonase [Glycine soja]
MVSPSLSLSCSLSLLYSTLALMVSKGVDSVARRLSQPYLGFGVLMRLSLSRTATPREVRLPSLIVVVAVYDMETSYIQYPGQYENVLKGFEALLSSSKNIALCPCSFSLVHFQVEGDVVTPKSTEAWKGQDSSKWIDFSNVNGLIIDEGGQIDGSGSVWWNSCKVKCCLRPTALSIHNCNNLQLTGIRHLNSARNHISINNSNHNHIFNVNIDAPLDSPNINGIDVSQSSYTLIQHSTIAIGDDCIAMNNAHHMLTWYTKCPGFLAQPVSKVQVSTTTVKENMMVTGCFQGELICKNLKHHGVLFHGKITTDDNAITNVVGVYTKSSNIYVSSYGKLLVVLGDSTECLLAV